MQPDAGVRPRMPVARRSNDPGARRPSTLGRNPARQRQQRRKEPLLPFPDAQLGRNPYHGYAAQQAFAADRNRDTGRPGIDLAILQGAAVRADVAQQRRQPAFVVVRSRRSNPRGRELDQRTAEGLFAAGVLEPQQCFRKDIGLDFSRSAHNGEGAVVEIARCQAHDFLFAWR
jgi:hypothetical protein